MATFTSHLLVRTLISLDLLDEKALLERVKKMETKDRYELTSVLDAISAAIPKKLIETPEERELPVLPERGIETLLLIDEPETLFNEEYNFKSDAVARLRRAHCNPNVMDKIKKVREELLKAHLQQPARVDSKQVLSTLSKRFAELEAELGKLKANNQPEQMEQLLVTLASVDDTFKSSEQSHWREQFSEILDGFHQKMSGVLNQGSSIVQETEAIFKLLTLLDSNCSTLEALRLLANQKGMDFVEKELKTFRTKSKEPVRAFLLKLMDAKLKTTREQLQEQFASLQSAISGIEKEKSILEGRLNRYRSFVEKREKERVDVALEKKELQNIDVVLSLVRILLGKTTFTEMKNEIPLALTQFPPVQGQKGPIALSREIILFLKAISEGYNFLPILIDTIKELNFGRPYKLSFDPSISLEEESKRFEIIRETLNAMVVIFSGGAALLPSPADQESEKKD